MYHELMELHAQLANAHSKTRVSRSIEQSLKTIDRPECIVPVSIRKLRILQFAKAVKSSCIGQKTSTSPSLRVQNQNLQDCLMMKSAASRSYFLPATEI